MSIRLIKVTRDLNVGITTVVEFLQKKGITVEVNPNTKISDEEYALLVKEFGQDQILKKETERISSERNQKEKRPEVVQIEETEVAATEIPEIETEIPEAMIPHIVTKGKIDLSAIGKRTVSTPKAEPVQQERIPETEQPAITEPVVEKPIETEKVTVEEKVEKEKPADEQISQTKETGAPDESSSEEEPFRLNRTVIHSTISVVGKIDPALLNQSTRPKKKTKEEKKKEYEERREKQNAQRRTPADSRLGQPRPSDPSQQRADNTSSDPNKQKRKRIKDGKIDVEKNAEILSRSNNHPNKPRKTLNLKKPVVKSAVNEEDVQRQVKETLARLTSKTKAGKGAKYRKEKREANTQRQNELQEMEEMESRILKITEFVTANDLANMMGVPVNQIIATCMSIGIMVSINQRLDAETINIVAEEFGFKTEYVSAEVVDAIHEEEDDEKDLLPRPPIVTVMGHVDHGKTSLLDNIRKTNVIAGEAGGITQHIGAYHVRLSNGKDITFLDTPGHEAFTAMRARGAKVTDIAIIIVAADDSIMPQTIEAINHASAAGVPIVFAINKIDKPGANPEKIKEALAAMNYLVEDWGGKYQSQDISAKKGIGIHELLEKVLLEAELLDLKANPARKAVGSIIESSLDKGRGYVSTVLVENGTLKMGDIVLAGTSHGRVKAMFNERNQRVTEAGPSDPVLILGLNGAPQAGDLFHVLDTEQEAREIANKREQLQREQGLRTQKMLTLDDIGRRIAIGNFQELKVIVKGDVDGSVEALSDSLIRLSTEEIQVNVIHKAVGQISESDISLAAASDAIIIGFQVRPSQAARRLAEQDGVEIRLYSVIYDAIEEVTSAMEGMLSPEIKEEIVANVEVREVFKITKVGTVAGCMVKEGKIKRSNKIRLIRDGIVIYSGELGSLKRFKDDVKEVAAGYECGLNITNYNDIKVGDFIEAFEETEVKKTL
ncbi:MAG: translation initiation factor IF-2 [Bacteroidales bacterium]|nr:translation initiation factor IF-2 [Bacteroidales bacterium]